VLLIFKVDPRVNCVSFFADLLVLRSASAKLASTVSLDGVHYIMTAKCPGCLILGSKLAEMSSFRTPALYLEALRTRSAGYFCSFYSQLRWLLAGGGRCRVCPRLGEVNRPVSISSPHLGDLIGWQSCVCSSVSHFRIARRPRYARGHRGFGEWNCSSLLLANALDPRSLGVSPSPPSTNGFVANNG